MCLKIQIVVWPPFFCDLCDSTSQSCTRNPGVTPSVEVSWILYVERYAELRGSQLQNGQPFEG